VLALPGPLKGEKSIVGTRYLGRLYATTLRRHSLTHPTWNNLQRFRGGFAVKI
jgi:hypothetical protein